MDPDILIFVMIVGFIFYYTFTLSIFFDLLSLLIVDHTRFPEDRPQRVFTRLAFWLLFHLFVYLLRL